MRKVIYSVVLIICLCFTLFGCGSKQDDAAANEESSIQSRISDAEESENQTETPDMDTFGILISLPENANWITDVEYSFADENNLTITYHDSIADSDCTLLVAKNEDINLPSNEYDETSHESWEGKTVSDQLITVKVQHKKDDEKAVLATWEYNEYRFAIMGEDQNDSDSIPKAALSIIYELD